MSDTENTLPQRTESEQKLDEYFRNSPTFQKCMSPERIQATKEAIDQIVKQQEPK